MFVYAGDAEYNYEDESGRGRRGRRPGSMNMNMNMNLMNTPEKQEYGRQGLILRNGYIPQYGIYPIDQIVTIVIVEREVKVQDEEQVLIRVEVGIVINLYFR
ncbi:MAG: hypothetical protein EZS28_001854 [Streblomastix strix]|uniref:Uncharacterized protein n=1 Tax=Streblomastix strix TaxID=222440 RepID=A0A5J4X6W8_9EUKA|nr:MAG: hypothetical protein EZS28_001854 [Streblomastix strix]